MFGITNPIPYAYMAAVMEEKVGEMSRTGMVCANAIPSGVLYDAKILLVSIVRDRAIVEKFDPSTSHASEGSAEAEIFLSFVINTDIPRQLSMGDKAVAVSLTAFFKTLKEEGENARYVQTQIMAGDL